MSNSPEQQAKKMWFEGSVRDFPYYHGQPVCLMAKQWGVVLVSLVLAFTLLAVPFPGIHSFYILPVKTLLFVFIPLFALSRMGGKPSQALFHSLRLKDFGWMLGFGVITLVASVIVGIEAQKLIHTANNPAVAALANQPLSHVLTFFAASIPQLIGEELITILPFLALFTLLTHRLAWRRTPAVLAAWLVSTIIFGAIHLPTYDWNILQCFLIIGTARIFLTLAYIVTKNIWVSAGAHIVNDWIIFTLAILSAEKTVSG